MLGCYIWEWGPNNACVYELGVGMLVEGEMVVTPLTKKGKVRRPDACIERSRLQRLMSPSTADTERGGITGQGMRWGEVETAWEEGYPHGRGGLGEATGILLKG